MSHSPSARSPFGITSRLAWPAAVFAVTALAFAGALRNGFVWDDWVYIAGAEGIRGFDLGRLRWMWTSFRGSAYCPLVWMSLAADHAVWGLDPFGYHLTNLVLHAANAVLAYLTALRLFRAAGLDTRPGRLEAAAAVAALFFGLHPLRVESVAWANERRDLLAGFFFLLSIRLYLEAGKATASSAACYALAALSKATVVPLPLVLLLLDRFPLRRWGSGAGRWPQARLLREKAAYLAIAAAAAGLAILGQRANANLVPLAEHGPLARLLQSAYGLGYYLAKTAAPVGLSILHPLPERASALVLESLCAAALVAGAAWLLSRSGLSRPARETLWGYYGFMLLPVLGLLQNGPQLVADRFSYLSCLGWAAAAGAWAAKGGWRLGTAWALLAAAFLLTQGQLRVWRDEASVWTEHVRLFPESAGGRVRLASALNSAGAFAAGEAEARRALSLRPGDRMALYYLAVALEAQGRPAEALRPLEALAKDHGAFAPAHRLLGWIHLAAGRAEEAEASLSRAAALDPGDAQARYLLGMLLVSNGRKEAGLAYLEAAGRLRPDDPRYRQALAR